MTRAAEKQSRKPRTASREVRRHQLVKAAIDSISKRGFSGTTLAHVTKGAKLSHGVVHFHFKNKEDLYDQTLGYLADEHYELWHDSMLAAGSDPIDQLIAIIEADFDTKVCTPKKLSVWFAFWGQAKYRPNYLRIHNKHDNDRYVEFVRLCQEIIDSGDYDDLDPEQTARIIESLIDGIWLDMVLYPTPGKRDKCRNDCFVFLSKLFPNHFRQIKLVESGQCGRKAQ